VTTKVKTFRQWHSAWSEMLVDLDKRISTSEGLESKSTEEQQAYAFARSYAGLEMAIDSLANMAGAPQKEADEMCNLICEILHKKAVMNGVCEPRKPEGERYGE